MKVHVPLVVALDGWVLDSGQHPAIVPGDVLEFALEIGHLVSANGAPRETDADALLPTYDLTARVLETTPRVTVFDFGAPAYAATSMVEDGLFAGDDEYVLAPGDTFAVKIRLGVDPYLGRTRPAWLRPELIRPWTVSGILRSDAGDPGLHQVSTTLPHSTTALYGLRLAEGLPTAWLDPDPGRVRREA